MIKMAIPKPIFIYIDNSNLFIGAKHLWAKKLRKDSRVRVDIGRVCNVVAAGRSVARRFLYGSEPPRIDTVWKKISEQGVDVTVHQRSKQGKEKKVDTQIVADITERACTTPIEERSTIVVITGDADMIPGIEKALQYGWKVEVATWKDSMSADYKEMEDETKGEATPKHLDEHLLEVTFINRTCAISDLSTRCDLNKFAVVLKVYEKTFKKWHSPKEWFPNDDWCEKVEDLADCKFQYVWADFEDSQEKRIFGLVLCFEKNGGKDNFMAKMIGNHELATKLFIINVQEYCYTLSIEKRVWNGSEKEVACLHEIEEEKHGQKRPHSPEVENEDNGSEDTDNKKAKHNS